MLRLYASNTQVTMPKTGGKIRKNLRLTQAKLLRAQRILGTETETDTVEQALDLVAFRQ
jgi:hypothetical protein